MINHEKIIQAIFASIDDINDQLPRGNKIEKSINTALFGSDGNLDSLGLVSLVTTVEQKIEEAFGLTINLLDNMSVLENENPFKTIKTLTDYLVIILDKKTNG